MGQTRFVRRSLATLADDLGDLGHDVCPTTVGRLLLDLDFSPRVNRKRFTGPPHPDRDRQFAYITQEMAAFLDAGLPVLSLDTKKKERVGDFKNAGAVWCREPIEVNCHDFARDAVCRAVPYGIYDVGRQRGYVSVGTSADTAAFAVAAVRRWWVQWGSKQYVPCRELLLVCDAGGANGYRVRLWKERLQVEIADRYGIAVQVCHYPTGASKWNPVEHRLFGPISTNWSGVPLQSLDLLLGYVRGTRVGDRPVEAWPDERRYVKGVKVSSQQMQELDVQRHDLCPQWNYTIEPRPIHLWN